MAWKITTDAAKRPASACRKCPENRLLPHGTARAACGPVPSRGAIRSHANDVADVADVPYPPGCSSHRKSAALARLGWHTPIAELMHANPICALEGLSLDAARQALIAHGLDVLAIVDCWGRPLGILLPEDLPQTSSQRRSMKVRDVMWPVPAAVPRDARFSEVVGILERASGRPLPVIDDEGRLVGLLPPPARLEAQITGKVRRVRT